jgi:hypothetical protein
MLIETVKPRLHFSYFVFFGVRKCTDSKGTVISEEWRKVMQKDVEMAKFELVLLNLHRLSKRTYLRRLCSRCLGRHSNKVSLKLNV